MSIVWSLIALAFGTLIYLSTPILAPIASTNVQLTIARYHSGLAMRAYRQAAIVRRRFGTYELYPLSTNDEEKLAQVTLDSGLLSDDEKLEFNDPDDRLSRLHRKPFALVTEGVPAAIDAELAELGHWVHQHEQARGFYDDDTDTVNPYVGVASTLRAVDPADMIYIIGKNIAPGNIKTARVITKDRFSKYGTDIGLAETLGTLTGFAVGVGAVAGLQYMQQNLLDGAGGGGGGGGPTFPMPPTIMPYLHDMLVVAT